MTTRNITQFHSELQKSATTSTSESFNANVVIVESHDFAGIGAYKKSKTGKVPRLVERALAESANTALRSEMQEARVELAREMLSDESPSLNKIRLSRGYSQQQLAKLIGTSQPHIANIEAGKTELYFDTVCRLADALGVELNEMRLIIESQKTKLRNAS